MPSSNSSLIIDESNIAELDNPTIQSTSLLSELYTCKTVELCLIKYICGVTSLIFVVIFSVALKRIRRRQDIFELDFKDRLLLYVGLGESALVLLYHILFNHLIFLFIIRLAKMLEQVTICFILVDLTFKKLNLRLAFTYTVYSCLLATLIVSLILFQEGSYDLLHERRLFWTLLSGV
jgi:hypothetical protein